MLRRSCYHVSGYHRRNLNRPRRGWLRFAMNKDCRIIQNRRKQSTSGDFFESNWRDCWLICPDTAATSKASLWIAKSKNNPRARSTPGKTRIRSYDLDSSIPAADSFPLQRRCTGQARRRKSQFSTESNGFDHSSDPLDLYVGERARLHANTIVERCAKCVAGWKTAIKHMDRHE